MSLEFYSLINFFAGMIAVAGFVLPALIIYFYSSYKNHIALIASAAILMFAMLFVGEYIVVLLPFILPIIFAGLMGSLLRKTGQEFWLSMGYMIVAELAGIIIGIIIIYFYYGMQDIAGLLAEGFRNAYQNISADDEIGNLGVNFMTQIMILSSQGVAPDLAEISAMSIADKLDMIVPIIKKGMASVLPSYVMGYGILSGVWAWFISSVMLTKRAAGKKSMPGAKNYEVHPPFSEWKLPRWFTNVLMLLLLAAIIISFIAQGPMLNVAGVLQVVVMVILGIQGLSVLNWWLKKKKVHIVANVIICCASVVLFSFFLPWIGIFDIVFSFRMSQKQKEAIMEKMEEIKKQVDEQKRNEKEQEKKDKTKDQEEKEDNEQDESEKKK